MNKLLILNSNNFFTDSNLASEIAYVVLLTLIKNVVALKNKIINFYTYDYEKRKNAVRNLWDEYKSSNNIIEQVMQVKEIFRSNLNC